MHDVRELYSTLNKDPCRVRAYCASPGPESPPARSATRAPATPHLFISNPKVAAAHSLPRAARTRVSPDSANHLFPAMQTIEPENGPYVGSTFGAKCSGTGNVPEIFLLPGSSDCWMRWYANWDKNRPPLHIYPKSGSALTYVSAQPRLRAAIFSCLTEEHSRFVG
jgi:hypothetical protein